MTKSPTHPEDELALGQLALFLDEAKQILAAWDDYSDQHTNPIDGWPDDETAYAVRRSQLNADTWRSYNRIRLRAKDLLATAAAELEALPERSVHPHWAWKTGRLQTAHEGLDVLQSQWLDLRAALPASARPGAEEYDAPLAERNVEAWQYFDQWSLHGKAVLDIHNAWRRSQSRPTPAPVAPILRLDSSAARPRR
ncbi:hypothetical protein ACGFYY_41145 [Streptomyces sp. NPDC048331]|uniref:hypothetical protein n=1 Tax=Streptomyces sp. NPDC048331 TaxID=3365534 RepID=UPI0037186E46